MKRRSEGLAVTTRFEDLIGLGAQSARKTYHAELAETCDQLETERNRYQWLFENALQGIFSMDLRGRLREMNPSMARLCGYDNPEAAMLALGDPAQELFGGREHFQKLLDALLPGGAVQGYQTQIRRHDGQWRDVELNVLLKQEHGGPVIEACIQDVTERVQAQRSLRELNSVLESRVAARTSELTTVNQQLLQEIWEREQIEQQLNVAIEAAEQANRSKDKYLAAASHDLLQPMNAARLLVAALRERPLGSEDNHLVERVHLALESAEQLLTDLLDIARLDQQGVQPDLSEFPLSDLFDTLQAEFQPVAEQAGLEFRVHGIPAMVRSDMRLLLRILRNLLSNAIRYTSEGRVLLGCRRVGNQLSLQVWDSGDGIPANKLQEIFTEFQQLECHTRGERKGVGLGLAIVDRIARALAHPIEVSSRPGRGSMFSVQVPLLSRAVPQPSSPLAALPVVDLLSGRCCLVIDNEQSILLSMKALLSQWGATVILAQDAEQALAFCQQGGAPDLILADYHLEAGRTGIEAIAAVRQQVGDIPAMLITADRSDASRRHYREQGLPVLNKPVKPGKLRALISHLLGS